MTPAFKNLSCIRDIYVTKVLLHIRTNYYFCADDIDIRRLFTRIYRMILKVEEYNAYCGTASTQIGTKAYRRWGSTETDPCPGCTTIFEGLCICSLHLLSYDRKLRKKRKNNIWNQCFHLLPLRHCRLSSPRYSNCIPVQIDVSFLSCWLCQFLYLFR